MSEQTITIDQAITLAREALDQGRPADAEVLMRKLSEISPPEATLPRFLLGLSLLALYRPAEALAVFREVIRVEPHATAVRSGIAEALEVLGNIGAAYDAYHTALIARPTDLRARWLGSRLLPRVYETETDIPKWRARFCDAIYSLTATSIETGEQAEAALNGVALKTTQCKRIVLRH